jgi:hypothetical protein
LAVDGEVVLQAPFDRSDRPLAPTSRPLAIGARQVDAQVEQLCTFRDVHYLDPRGFGEPWEAPALADDELFVLGDNVPISRDSRAWQAPLRRESLIGGVTPRKTEFIPFPP